MTPLLVVTTAAFLAGAWITLRWARVDASSDEGPSTRLAVASWLLYLLHADSVAVAALGGALVVPTVEPVRLAVEGAGVVLAVVGVAMFAWSARRLVDHGDFSGLRAQQLVTCGPYGLSRNPQNLAWGVLLAGMALWSRSVVAVALVVLFAVFVERFVRLEERQLERSFGAPYDAYRARVPRWLRAERPAT